MLEEELLKVYVDASVSANNHGGVGAVVVSVDTEGKELINEIQLTGYCYVNSVQLEILACADTLNEIATRRLDFRKKQITIYTDSKLVYEKYKRAMFHWLGNNWTEDGRPVSDAREWDKLVKQLRKYKEAKMFVDIQWIKGHNKNYYNDLAHTLAKRASQLPKSIYSKNSVLSAFRPQQIKAPKRIEIGSVKMMGQRVSIKVLGVEYLQVHKLWGCKYQVISTKSQYRGLVDKAFSRTSMDIGKSYYVKLNSSLDNPRIEKVYWEIQ
jgi:ribonuclease HI